MKKTTIFAGAGFSRFFFGLPLISELFDFRISEARVRDEPWLKKISAIKEKWDKNNPGVNNELFIADILNGPGVRNKKYLSWYISRRLSENFLCRSFGSFQTHMFDDGKVTNIKGIHDARSFLKNIGLENIQGIITTNYDLVFEYCLGTDGFNYGRKEHALAGRGHNPLFPWQNTPVVLKGNITLSKIHGSLSHDGYQYWTSGICGLNGGALIVPPIPDKSRPEVLKKEWNDAAKILKRTEKLIIFGFNFNEYDKSVLNLISTYGKRVKSVLIYDVESKMEKAIKIWDKKIIKEVNVRTRKGMELQLDPHSSQPWFRQRPQPIDRAAV